MRRPLLSSGSPIWAKVLGLLALVVAVPIVAIVKVITLPFERPTNRSPSEVAKYLRDFRDGTGDDWDWDDFVSLKIADPRLEDIRERASALDLPMPDHKMAPLSELIAEAEQIAASDQNL